MNIQHTKSSCCQVPIWHYGARRRQCSKCGRTWRVYQRKRGRKRRRCDWKLLKRIFLERMTLCQQTRLYRKVSLYALYKRLERNILSLANRPSLLRSIPGNLILVADAFWYTFNGKPWTLYIMAIKPVGDCQAILLDPLLLIGGESYENWLLAIESIPRDLQKRIIAFISDDFRASIRITREYNWIHQLCHFHLIARLQIRRGRRKKTIRGRNIREIIYQTIRQALLVRDNNQLRKIQQCLNRLANNNRCPKSMRLIIREFLRHINLYLAYQKYPELNLPTTTNAIETIGREIRRISRNLRTPKALKAWATALIRIRPFIVCNGKEPKKNQPN